MSQKVLEQIKKLSNLEYTLDNGSVDLDQYFSEITFKSACEYSISIACLKL